MSDDPYTAGARPSGSSAHVLRHRVSHAARDLWKPSGITDRDAISLEEFHTIVRKFSVPKWIKGTEELAWKTAFFNFKTKLTALFPATTAGSHEWKKLLFRYDEPAGPDQRWPDMREFDNGRWKSHKRTGQLWLLVQLTEDLWMIEDNEEEDLTRPNHLDGLVDPLREVKHALLGVRAIFVLRHNFSKAPKMGYNFDDFRDLLDSISAPVHHNGQVLGADDIEELEAAVKKYKDEAMSKICSAARWHELGVMVRQADTSVLGTFYIAITVRNNKTSIESGRWDAPTIIENVKLLSGYIDVIREVSDSLPRAPGDPTSAPGSHRAGRALPSLDIQKVLQELREQRSRSSSPA
ncbi:hypothetical protein Rt10032_c26g6811 [Rhodotorula toruloides]|uniref:Uncharacterized protein n=1 Tax=Rhodotorula toruloides TaxID=5286 RepID=A0A511KTB7_RHOTO|nr:hypothetical protein Rt10032_c26g6811 [Rhodotorula toruloides]